MYLKFRKIIAGFAIAFFVCGTDQIHAGIIEVPSGAPTIEQAVQNSGAGDTIMLSPGTYDEKNITINKPLTITSQWILTGDESVIDQTVINAASSILFSVNSNDVEISGLKIINGDHTLDINARTTVRYNRFYNNLDPVSMETGGGGYVGYNLFQNNSDDGIDLDISTGGSDILIEHNTIDDSNDDGIEIRLFSNPDQNIHYEIRYNTIKGSRRAGIQLISYDVYTGKVFDIHHNIIRNCKAGLGCMGGSNTTEDLGGAALMDEKVFLYNNTLIENEMGATGGNSMIAVNNIAAGNTIGGLKRFGESSAIANNLLYNNNGNDLIEINEAVQQSGNIFNADPLLGETTLMPGMNSPCIDAGLDSFVQEGIPVIEIGTEAYEGSAPDIGAVESGVEPTGVLLNAVANGFRISNFPNPFLLSTNISVYLSRPGSVKADIYDMTGRHIHTLEEGKRVQGMHTMEWSPRDENGHRLPGGIYVARVRMGHDAGNIKMLLLD